jgi:drug/metabolite transporter (DMT)-like permease
VTDRSQPAAHDGHGGLIGQHAWAPYFLVILTVGIYAGNHVVGRAVHNEISPMALVFWRSMGAAIVLAPFVARRFIRQWPLLRRNWKLFLVLALLQMVLGQSALYVGLQTSTALNAGFINSTMPALTVALAWLLAGETVSRRQVAGLIVASVGVLAIIMRGDLGRLLALAFVPGDLWLQFAFVCWSYYNILVNRLTTEINPFVAFMALTLTALPFLAMLYGAEYLLGAASAPLTLETVAAIAYVSVFASILALVCLNVGIAHIGSARSGMMFNLMPVITTGLAIILLGEQLRLYHVIGIALIFGGIYLSGALRRQKFAAAVNGKKRT